MLCESFYAHLDIVTTIIAIVIEAIKVVETALTAQNLYETV